MSHELEARIHRLAGEQHGVVTRKQLLAAGMSAAAIGRRMTAGRLRGLHAGVYLLGPVEPDRARAMAAVLAGGRDAVLSHTSAAGVWGIRPIDDDGPVHVSVPGRSLSRTSGILFHRVAPLRDDELARNDGIALTSPTRTLVDAAGLLGSREIELALASAERAGLVRGDEMRATLDRHPGRPGVGILRALVSQRAGPTLTRSEAERRGRSLVRQAGLPAPHTNVRIGPYELDMFWPEEGLAIEIDGHAYHASRARFEGDRQKDAWLRARGIEVIRLTWRQITRDPIRTAVQIGQVLALAGARHAGPARREEGPAHRENPEEG